MSTFGDRVRALRQAKGINLPELAKRTGLTKQALSKIELGETKRIYDSTLLAIARGLGESPESLRGEKPSEQVGESPAIYSAKGDYELVMRVKGAVLSAGPGRINFEHEEIDDSHAFRSDWMRKHGLKKERCRVLEVDGDSMSPYLNDGDVVLVNLDDQRIKNGEVYAIAVDEEARIKRLFRRADGAVEIRSDNESIKHRAETIDPEKMDRLVVIGRVVWRGG